MANLHDAMNLAFKIGYHADNLVFDRDQKGTLLTLALTGAVGGAVGYPLRGTAAAAAIGTGIRYFGYVRYPVGSIGVKLGIRGAPQYLFASKAYVAMMLAYNVREFDKQQALFRQKEWKRLGISVMGPPGSLWLYDKIYNGPAKESLASSSSPSQQNGGAKGKKSPYGKKLSKLPKGYSYSKKKGEQCAHGFKLVGNKCVKQ